MNEPPRSEPEEPPPLAQKRGPKVGFGAQVSIGIFSVIALVGLCFATRSTQVIQACVTIVPLAGVGCCFFRDVRGLGVGLLLGIGLSGIALIGLCFATLKM